MDIIDKYLSGLMFTKVDTLNGFAVYAAYIAGLYAGGFQRYILLFVPLSKASLQHAKSNQLEWQNMQTRLLRESNYRLQKQTWTMPENIPDPRLTAIERTDKSTEYVCEDNGILSEYEIHLLHNPKKKTRYQFHGHINLSAALQTFSSLWNRLNTLRVRDDPLINIGSFMNDSYTMIDTD